MDGFRSVMNVLNKLDGHFRVGDEIKIAYIKCMRSFSASSKHVWILASRLDRFDKHAVVLLTIHCLVACLQLMRMMRTSNTDSMAHHQTEACQMS